MKKKVALVTGGSSGIGEATAKLLNKVGYNVYAVVRRLDKMKDELAPHGINTVHLDLTDEKSIIACINNIIEKEGGIDILINNTGYSNYGSMEEMPLDNGKKHFTVNVFGIAHLSKLVIPYMRKNKYGKIVNISSTGGKIAGPFWGGGTNLQNLLLRV